MGSNDPQKTDKDEVYKECLKSKEPYIIIKKPQLNHVKNHQLFIPYWV